MSIEDHRDAAVRVRAPASYLWLRDRVAPYIALCALALFAPLMLWIAWRIRRDSPGPALFRQTRAGLHGRPFTFYKFRSMRTDVDPFGDSPSDADDPRITRLGRWLRETSLDELPQLFNVVRGEMTLVGPRPLFVQQIREWNDRQRCRLLVKPGLTGFSQIHGRASIPIEEKLEWDIRYVESVCLKTDLWVLWRTLRSVRDKEGLYQTEYSRQRARFRPAK
ncbi:MAG: sugar transferase [Planctomycetota bacterium]|nr:MAG: sugar transferase [Planctomycetota bacterium]